MGNDVDGLESGMHRDGSVQILDVRAEEPEARPTDASSRLLATKRRRIVVGGLVLAGLFGGLTLLPAINETPPPERISPPVETLDACQAVEQAAHEEAVELGGGSDGASARHLPSGASLYGVMTSRDTTELVGLAHPDGSVEICEDSARLAPFNVRFASEADLGELPEGMTYAYEQPGGFLDNTLVLDLRGVRLRDGTVVRSLTLSDGRILPAPPASDQ